MIYVGGQTGLQPLGIQKDPCSEHAYSETHNSCGLPGAAAPPAGYTAAPEAGGRGGGGRGGAPMIGGVSILKPRQLGGVTGYNLNSGDKAWWSPNGGQMRPVTSADPLFAGVTLPPAPNQGSQAQIIVTKTLTIYGTGRSGGAPTQLFALDKATGKQVGAVTIPSKTTAMPMTFMYQGKQYIVFATGAGTTTSLVAMTLPR